MEETTETTTPEAVEPEEPQEQPEAPENDEPDTFPRQYVEDLRQEAARHRQRAKQSDDLAVALWEARVAATGRLADPTDLPMPADGDPLDAESVTAAVDTLLESKPHLARRVPRGDIGQGAGTPGAGSTLADILRARA